MAADVGRCWVEEDAGGVKAGRSGMDADKYLLAIDKLLVEAGPRQQGWIHLRWRQMRVWRRAVVRWRSINICGWRQAVAGWMC